MKRLATIIALFAGLAAGPVMADHGSNKLLNKENVGGALGAAVGGLLGNELGDRKPAITAAGAVGGWILGQNIAHNYKNSPARRTYGDDYRWDGRRYHRGHDRDWDRDRHHRRLHPVNRTFVAKTTSNVRAGPSTRHRVVGRLHDRERVHVVGKVKGRNWVMVRDHGRNGFVYAPLLRPYRHYGNDRGHGYDRYHGRRDFDDRDGGYRAGW